MITCVFDGYKGVFNSIEKWSTQFAARHKHSHNILMEGSEATPMTTWKGKLASRWKHQSFYLSALVSQAYTDRIVAFDKSSSSLVNSIRAINPRAASTARNKDSQACEPQLHIDTRDLNVLCWAILDKKAGA